MIKKMNMIINNHKDIKKTAVFISVVLFSLLRLSAQSSMVATGGEAPGSEGIASFTVGEVFYTHKSSAFGSAGDGMQQSDSQPYCYGAKVSDLAAAGTNIKWYAAVIGGKARAQTAILKTATYYYTHTTNNITSARIPVVVNVTPLARSGKVSSPASVCFNGNITFSSAAIAGDEIQWEYTTDTPLSASNTTPPIWLSVLGATGLVYTKTNVTNTPRSKFYIRAKITSGTCTTAYSAVKTIIVNPTSVGGTATGGGVICSGGGGTLKLTGYTGTIQWLSSTNGLAYTAVASAKAASLRVTGLTQNTWYKAQVTSGSCASTFSNPIQFTIGTTATVGIVSAQTTSICKGTATTLQLGTGNYGSILWEKSTNGGTTWTSALGKTTTLTTSALSATTWFRATTYIGTSATVNCTVAHSEPIVISVIAAPLSKGITGNTITGTNNGATLAKALACTDDRKILTVNAGYNGAIQWQWSTTSNPSVFNNIASATGTSYAISSVSRATGANYYRVKFTNSCGVFVYSNPITVYYKDCAPVAKIMNPVIAKIQFDAVAYPNPSSSNFNLNITTSSAENVEVKVYDVLGRLIIERHTKEPSMKIGANYPSGTYILKVSQGENQKTLQVIKK